MSEDGKWHTDDTPILGLYCVGFDIYTKSYCLKMLTYACISHVISLELVEHITVVVAIHGKHLLSCRSVSWKSNTITLDWSLCGCWITSEEFIFLPFLDGRSQLYCVAWCSLSPVVKQSGFPLLILLALSAGQSTFKDSGHDRQRRVKGKCSGMWFHLYVSSPDFSHKI